MGLWNTSPQPRFNVKRLSQSLGFLLVLAATIGVARTASAAEPASVPENFQRDNLIAWCIVPFDAGKRNPAQRAEMIIRLGMRRVAYDWRAKHVPQFEEEILQYKQNGIEFFAFWSWHDSIEPLIKKHQIKPQIWVMCLQPKATSHAEKIAEAAQSLIPLVSKTKGLGLSLGIYNHGGWTGQPENMVAVCEHLRDEHNADHVGIVYNFHHGHEHIERFSQTLKQMKPYLLCLNLNGMNDSSDVQRNAANNKIVTIGKGRHETSMIDAVIRSGYRGPIGVLDHRSNMDAEESLRLNLDGLESLLSSRDSGVPSP